MDAINFEETPSYQLVKLFQVTRALAIRTFETRKPAYQAGGWLRTMLDMNFVGLALPRGFGLTNFVGCLLHVEDSMRFMVTAPNPRVLSLAKAEFMKVRAAAGKPPYRKGAEFVNIEQAIGSPDNAYDAVIVEEWNYLNVMQKEDLLGKFYPRAHTSPGFLVVGLQPAKF